MVADGVGWTKPDKPLRGGNQCSGLIWYKILSAYNFGPSNTEIVTVLLTILAVGAGRNCKLAFFPGGKPPTA